MGEEIEGAMQQAPHFFLQINFSIILYYTLQWKKCKKSRRFFGSLFHEEIHKWIGGGEIVVCILTVPGNSGFLSFGPVDLDGITEEEICILIGYLDPPFPEIASVLFRGHIQIRPDEWPENGSIVHLLLFGVVRKRKPDIRIFRIKSPYIIRCGLDLSRIKGYNFITGGNIRKGLYTNG